MFKVDTSEIRGLEKQLGKFKKTALKHAVKATLNDAAFDARRNAKDRIEKEFVLRNKWTTKTIQIEKARGLNVSTMKSKIGSTAPYMETQEFGGTEQSAGKEGVPIPTSYSAGQAGQPRTRLPRKPNQLGSIKLSNRRKRGTSRKQRNLAAIRGAASSGRPYVFLDLERSRGIFKVVGGKRKPRIKMVYDLSRKSVKIPKKPWLRPSFEESVHKIPDFYLKAVRFQVNRLRLFKK